MSGTLRSGQVAAAAGVHVQTLRYDERRGLLPAPARGNGGHRGSHPRCPPFATPAGGR
ncbi:MULTISPECIES: MerR family DNA-binding transcriptional regulator [unclassified Streptomyces]|uniref:MerR family DNA-binding transcriptional regulator n=1 Tax=unclassified Streptomyces TaxID=2593676 RepID=UPI000AB36E9F|nr:MerR family DNA-binding transcriptional regulator [Streptomyces sp. CNQ-509]